MIHDFDITKVDWAKGGGLVPAVIQDAKSGRVLMLGYVTEDSLRLTLETSRVTFFSRSKQRLWTKGETSGHVLHLRHICLDCDGDTFLLLVDAVGPTCHRGTQSCFGNDIGPALATLADLAGTIRSRRHAPTQGSYTARLFADGIARIAQKVGEEGVETALAAVTDAKALPSEAADLIYHLMVLLEAGETDLFAVTKKLEDRAESASIAGAIK